MNKPTTINLSVLRQALGSIPNTANWEPIEYTENLSGGGELTVRGYKCSSCGFFRRKRHGMSKYCEDCGAKMLGGEENV